jgi:hypothetical protein
MEDYQKRRTIILIAACGLGAFLGLYLKFILESSRSLSTVYSYVTGFMYAYTIIMILYVLGTRFFLHQQKIG